MDASACRPRPALTQAPLAGAGLACPTRGFTLIEILVALAILAVALTAGMRAITQAADGATLLKQRTLALWVAQNRLAQTQLSVPWPAIGQDEGFAEQAGEQFVWRQRISYTPNPSFRKVEITVVDPANPSYALALLVGYLGATGEP